MAVQRKQFCLVGVGEIQLPGAVTQLGTSLADMEVTDLFKIPSAIVNYRRQ